MEFAEAKNEIIRVREELTQVETQIKELNKIYMEHRKKVNLCENRKRELSKEIKKLEQIIEAENVFESVQGTEGFETLLKSELVAISNGMDKTDYSKMDLVKARSKEPVPRWYDLERLVKEVIAFKKLYPGWILEYLAQSGAYDTLPPETFYKYTYKSPHGHYMSMGGIEHIN